MSLRSCSSHNVREIRLFPVRVSLRPGHSSQGVPEIRLFQANFPEIRLFPVRMSLRWGYAIQSFPEVRPFPVVACTPVFSSVALLSQEKDETDSGYRSGTIPDEKLPKAPSQATLNRKERRRKIQTFNHFVPKASLEEVSRLQSLIFLCLNSVAANPCWESTLVRSLWTPISLMQARVFCFFTGGGDILNSNRHMWQWKEDAMLCEIHMRDFKSNSWQDFLAYCTRPVSVYLVMVYVGCLFNSFSVFLLSLKRQQNLMKILFSCIHFPIWPYPPKIMREKKYFIPVNCMCWQVCNSVGDLANSSSASCWLQVWVGEKWTEHLALGTEPIK